MSTSEKNTTTASSDASNKIIWIVVAIVAALIIGGIVFFLRQSPSTNVAGASGLANAIRPGSPEWNMYHDKVVLDKPEADEAKRALGDWQMTLRSTVRNFTGRTINGLEIHAAVLDLQRKPIKERTVVVIPTKQPELEPNKTMPVSILIEGMKDSDTRADIQMEVTGFTFK